MENFVCVVGIKFMDIDCKLLYSLGIKEKMEQRIVVFLSVQKQPFTSVLW